MCSSDLSIAIISCAAVDQKRRGKRKEEEEKREGKGKEEKGRGKEEREKREEKGKKRRGREEREKGGRKRDERGRRGKKEKKKARGRSVGRKNVRKVEIEGKGIGGEGEGGEEGERGEGGGEERGEGRSEGRDASICSCGLTLEVGRDAGSGECRANCAVGAAALLRGDAAHRRQRPPLKKALEGLVPGEAG